ncbi:MAG: nuclear transport factor 2 family protein [Burkholderiaceae bacterium]|nr:nuclear transport factor 2 family protein [Burkholderiaceae bacterium]
MHPNAKLLTDFYSAFQRLDAEAMAACYAAEVRFSDPVFPMLQGSEAGDMWRMLAARARDFSLKFDDVSADDHSGSAHWVATYTFSQTGNTVVNDIQASFEFKDGKIVRHVDHFDLWRWARQALGPKGLLLGWTPLVRAAIRKQAAKGLAAHRKQEAK